MSQIFFNGKFTAQRTTGVQRYAHQLVLALDELLASRASAPIPECVLLCPPSGQAPKLLHIQVRRVGPSGWPLHAWEQLVLPWAARKGLLISLAGSAPWWAARQWCTFHDAAVFDHPDSYKPLFVAWYRSHFLWLAKRAERVLTVSSHSRGRLAARLRLAPASIAIVPNGGDHLLPLRPDERLLTSLALTHGRFLLAVGSENRTKNWASLMRAFAALSRDPELKLVLVGGSDTAVFAQPGTAAPIPGVVHAGVVEDAALKGLYNSALALVFPSLDEGFGLPPLEALSLGCAVAAARAGAVPEVCGDAVLYFDPNSVAAICAALNRLISDTELRDQLRAGGPAQAARWTWQRSAQTLLDLLLQPARGAR